MADYTTAPANINFSASAEFDSGKLAAAALAVGTIVRLDDNNHWAAAEADSLANAGTALGIVAAASAAANQPCIVCTHDPQLQIGIVLTMGTAVVLSAANAGKMAPAGDISTGEAAVLLGWPLSRNATADHEDNKIHFQPVVSLALHP